MFVDELPANNPTKTIAKSEAISLVVRNSAVVLPAFFLVAKLSAAECAGEMKNAKATPYPIRKITTLVTDAS